MSVGVEAVPIVSLISFFVGTILALQGAYQLRKLGAMQLVAAAVAIVITRELGPLMTAIMVIGRSGSAFAAEIGTMKVNEEIDALETMALEPVHFLVAPKFLAMILMMPCLTTWADFMGVVGGGFFGVMSAGFTWGSYFRATLDALVLRDIVTGLDQERDVRDRHHGRGVPRRLRHRPRLRRSGTVDHFGGGEIDFSRYRRRPDFHGHLLFHGALTGIMPKKTNAADDDYQTPSGPSIQVRNLRVNYGEREILHSISFEVPAGETMVILGGSGSGKSTLLRTLVGLEKPTRRRDLDGGQEFRRHDRRRARRAAKKNGHVVSRAAPCSAP